MKFKIGPALEFATKYHEGQTDKAGMAYILHPIRVANSLEHDDEKIVALLHDVVEDTNATLTDVRAKFGEIIADAVDAITKRSHEYYREYLDRVRNNQLALTVKLEDMNDNSQPDRIKHLPIAKQIRLAAKYARGRHYLLTGEWHESKALDTVIREGQ